MSGRLTRQDLTEALQHGVHGAIEKPFRVTDVITACNLASRKSRLSKLLEQATRTMLYHFGAIEEHLTQSGQIERRNKMKSDLLSLLARKRELQSLLKK